MIRTLTLAAIVATPALAQMPVAGQPGSTPGAATTGLNNATPLSPTLPQPATGVAPPAGAATAGTAGDGRVGTLAPGAATPGVTGQPGMRPTTGVTATTPTTNPPPR